MTLVGMLKESFRAERVFSCSSVFWAGLQARYWRSGWITGVAPCHSIFRRTRLTKQRASISSCIDTYFFGRRRQVYQSGLITVRQAKQYCSPNR
jgi:hypothetical protein